MRALSLKKRMSTFPFDVTLVTLSTEVGEHEVSLIREAGRTPEEQGRAYCDETLGYKHARFVSALAVVERHTCEYKRCDCCDTELLRDSAVTDDQYDTPWDEKPKERHYCSDYCRQYDRGEIDKHDFAYFECARCARSICEQNPQNGYHIQYRELEPHNEVVCLRCYQEHLLEHGHDRDEFEGDKCSGMFFDHDELRDAGFHKYGSYFLQFSAKGSDLQREALALVDAGNKVIVDYEAMGMGIEGHVGLWFKGPGLRVLAKSKRMTCTASR